MKYIGLAFVVLCLIIWAVFNPVSLGYGLAGLILWLGISKLRKSLNK